jgi:ubiquinone/menaquinone biosynthesis C-methylase UbiE
MTWRRVFGRGVFPYAASWLLDLRWRNWLLAPAALVARLPLASARHALEVGAGSGFYSAAVARSAPRGSLTLLDLQPEMLHKARQKMPPRSLVLVHCAAADARFLPFRDGAFDLVFLVTVLGEIPDPPAFLREAHRVLTDNGVLTVGEHLPDPDFITASRLALLAASNGFEPVETHGRWWSYTVTFRKRPRTAESDDGKGRP